MIAAAPRRNGHRVENRPIDGMAGVYPQAPESPATFTSSSGSQLAQLPGKTVFCDQMQVTLIAPDMRARLLRLLVFGLAKALGLLALSRWLTRGKLRILGYHGIWFSEGHFGNRIFMKPDTFRHRMEWLAASRFPVLSLNEAVERLYGGTLPACAVVITIDDGWYGTYKYMAPVLKALSLPATVYVTTKAVDTQLPHVEIALQHICKTARVSELAIPDTLIGDEARLPLATVEEQEAAADFLIEGMKGLSSEQQITACKEINAAAGGNFESLLASRQLHNMTYDEVRGLAVDGIDIQLHTHDHDLSPDQPARIASEIRLNRDKLAATTPGPLNHFCYPSGVYSAAMYPYLDQEGIRSATTVEAGLNDSQTHRFALSRILDGEYVPRLEIEAELSGFLELKRMFLGALRPRRLAGSTEN